MFDTDGPPRETVLHLALRQPVLAAALKMWQQGFLTWSGAMTRGVVELAAEVHRLKAELLKERSTEELANRDQRLEIEDEALGHLVMFLDMVDDATGEKLAEGWEADADAMGFCSSEARSWIEARRDRLAAIRAGRGSKSDD